MTIDMTDISLFLVLALIIQPIHGQPAFWGDVCTLDEDGESTNCYLWTGAPFPFNDIASFLKNNPFCPIIPGQKCNIFISPVLVNCQVTTLANDTSGITPPQGCQFYKPVDSTPPSSVILCNLNVNCSDRGSGVGKFLFSVYTTFNLSMNADWLELFSQYAISDMFGGRNTVSFPNSFFQNLFSPAIDINHPPPVRIQWDGPITITTPSITLDSMWAVAGLSNPSIPYLPVNVLVSSPQNSPTPNALPSCNVFTIRAPSVVFKNMAFYIDPVCNTTAYVSNTRGTIVFSPASSAGIGSVDVTNVSSTPTVYPLIYIFDNYQPSSTLTIDMVLFDSNLDGYYVPPSSPLPSPPQTVSSFASVILQYGGTATVDTTSPGLIFATTKLKCVNSSTPVGCAFANFVDAFSLYTGVSAGLLGCQATIYSNSVCDQKNSTDLVLVISTSILLATMLLFAIVELCRRRRITLDRAITDSAERADVLKLGNEDN